MTVQDNENENGIGIISDKKQNDKNLLRELMQRHQKMYRQNHQLQRQQKKLFEIHSQQPQQQQIELMDSPAYDYK